MKSPIRSGERKRYIIGIDASLSCTGWCYLDFDTRELIKYGKICTRASDFKDEIERCVCIKDEILYRIVKAPVMDVALEGGYVGSNPRTGLQLGLLRGMILGSCSDHKYNYSLEAPSAIRKALGLNGNAKKEEVYEFLQDYYKDCPKFHEIGEFSDRQNKSKTSDIYDSIGIALAYSFIHNP